MKKNKLLLATFVFSFLFSSFNNDGSNFNSDEIVEYKEDKTNIKRLNTSEVYTDYEYSPTLKSSNFLPEDKIKHEDNGTVSLAYINLDLTDSYYTSFRLDYYFKGDILEYKCGSASDSFYFSQMMYVGLSPIVINVDGADTFKDFSNKIRSAVVNEIRIDSYGLVFDCNAIYYSEDQTTVFTLQYSFYRPQKVKLMFTDLTYGNNKTDVICEHVSLKGNNDLSLSDSAFPKYTFYFEGEYGIKKLIERHDYEYFFEIDQKDSVGLSFLCQQFFALYMTSYTAMNVRLIDSANFSIGADCKDYSMTFRISDSLNKTESFNEFLRVRIKDIDPPVLSLKENNLRLKYYDEEKEKKIEENIIVKDISDIASVTYEYDKSSLLFPGIKEIKAKATDVYDNFSEKTFNIEIIDDKPPILTGYDLIKTSISKVFSVSDILKMYTSYDEIDGNCTITIFEDEYHRNNNSTKAGTYKISLGSIDKSNNSVKKEVLILVEEDIKEPTYYLSQDKLTIPKGTVISAMEIAEKMKELGILDKDTIYVNCFRLEGYEIDGTNEVGTFKLKLQLDKNEKEYDIIELMVEIIEKDDLNGDNSSDTDKDSSDNNNKNDSSNSSTNSFVKFFQNLFNSIISFFKKLFGNI